MKQDGSCLLCGTPRTGSTLLCNLLRSTGVAGNPESYFRQPDEITYAERWGLAWSSHGVIDYAEFVRASRVEGSTSNGFYSARIMWGSMEDLIDRLGLIYPDADGQEVKLLTYAFGAPRFIQLQRQDVVAQAVSWLRAEQSGIWHIAPNSLPRDPEQKSEFDFEEAHKLVQVIQSHNDAWRQWFAAAGVTPFQVWYEELDSDPIGVTQDILQFLELELPPGRRINADNVRMADELSVDWIHRYRDRIAES